MSQIVPENAEVGTWWIQDEGDEVYLIVEPLRGEELTFDITDADSPGVIHE